MGKGKQEEYGRFIYDEALDQMSDATAHALLTFAQTTSSVNGTAKGSGTPSADFEYKGSHLQK